MKYAIGIEDAETKIQTSFIGKTDLFKPNSDDRLEMYAKGTLAKYDVAKGT
ncbi:hypothetical protein Plhal304r1_c028g0092071 [Plasmopara halstedii]